MPSNPRLFVQRGFPRAMGRLAVVQPQIGADFEGAQCGRPLMRRKTLGKGLRFMDRVETVPVVTQRVLMECLEERPLNLHLRCSLSFDALRAQRLHEQGGACRMSEEDVIAQKASRQSQPGRNGQGFQTAARAFGPRIQIWMVRLTKEQRAENTRCHMMDGRRGVRIRDGILGSRINDPGIQRRAFATCQRRFNLPWSFACMDVPGARPLSR